MRITQKWDLGCVSALSAGRNERMEGPDDLCLYRTKKASLACDRCKNYVFNFCSDSDLFSNGLNA